MGKFTVRRICIDGMLAAIYCILSVASFTVYPNVQITFAGLAVIVAAIAYGAPDALFVALVGAIVSELRSGYGFSITTPMWIASRLVRAIIVGIVASIFLHKKQRMEDHPVICSITIVVAAICVTGANTLALWLDSIIIGYHYSFVLVTTLIRFGVGILEAGITCVIVIPLMRALRKAGVITRPLVEKEEPIETEKETIEEIEEEKES